MNRKGITLIELLVALTISGILVAGVYRTFVSQQHTYTVQEQVVDMQQNVRLAINRMTRELRMAGFGKMDATFFGGGGMHGTFSNVVNPGGGGTSVTVVEGYQTVIPTTLSAYAPIGSKKDIQVNDASGFDTGKKRYICINGTESLEITKITGNQIDFKDGTKQEHFAGEPVFLVMAITYSRGISEGKWALLRDDNLGLGAQPIAENIDDLQFAYLDLNGNPTANPDFIRMIQVTIIARTDKTDPELAKAGDGFRRRTLTTNIQLRNLAF
jgi:prepilin-type N-terminal cleavage/methylation domain-containing protein